MGTDAPLNNLLQAFVTPAHLVLSPTDLSAWQQAFRGLPLVVLGILVWIVARGARRPRQVIRLAFAIFALLLLAKIALNVRIQHYGFALTMPAVLLTATTLLNLRPRSIVVRSIVLMLLGVVVAVHLYVYAIGFRDKPVVVAPDKPDMFLADARGELVNALVRILSDLPPQATVAVFPQGATVNYLSSHVNPTPFFTLMPPEVLMFGDERIAAAYEKSPPDVIVLIETDLSEYGHKSFDEVAPKTAKWMRENYAQIRLLPAPTPRLPAARILRRR